MSNRRPDRVYGILVRDGRVFLRASGAEAYGLPGGVFRPLAQDPKVELRGHLYDQLGIDGRAIWTQCAFDYADPAGPGEAFSAFYTVWDWEGDVDGRQGTWISRDDLAGVAGLPPPVRVLLLSVLETVAVRTGG